jgi:hypothetical protein
MYDDLIGTMVVIRTYSAGVHFGTLVAVDGRKVKLTDARRIWYWKGANTLNEIATVGVDIAKSKVSAPASKIVLTQAIEVMAMEPAAVTNLAGATWAS